MRFIAILVLSSLSVSCFSQTARSKQSITISPKATWVAVGKSRFGRPYEITISKYNDRGNGNADGSIYRSFTINSMLHNEYFSFLKDKTDKVVKTSNGYKLHEDEISDLDILSEDPIIYSVNHSIFLENDSLARNYGTVNYQFNPWISSINFYDEKTLIIYGNLGVFALTVNKIQDGQFINNMTLLLSAEFSNKKELQAYFIYKEHDLNELILEKKIVKLSKGEQIVDSGGIYAFNLITKTLTPYEK